MAENNPIFTKETFRFFADLETRSEPNYLKNYESRIPETRRDLPLEMR